MKTFFIITIALLCATFLSAQNVPNGGFEDWTDGEPDEWGTSNIPGSDVITQSTDAFSGSFAARGQSIEVNNDNLPVDLEADGPPGAFGLGFPISQKFTRMTFRYKLDNGNNDQFIAIVSIRRTDSVSMGSGYIIIEDNSTDWSLGTVLIDYSRAGTPGFAIVQFILEDGTGGEPPSTDAFFIVDDVVLDLTTDVNDDNSIVPDKHHLYNNYPNPFNPSTTIKFSLPEAGDVQLIVYDVLGNEVSTLVNDVKPAGINEVEWNASNVPSGIYFYKLQAGSFIETKKMVLMK